MDAEAAVPEVTRKLGISEATYSVWRTRYDQMTVAEIRRLRQLEVEYRKLKQNVGDRPHLLRDLVRVVDFEFVNTAWTPLPAEETGRPPYEPALISKLVCLRFLYNLSGRQAGEAITFNLLYKWFLGLAANERLPRSYDAVPRPRPIWG